MIHRVVFLLCDSLVDVVLYPALRENPIHLILEAFLCGHPVFALPITRSTEINVVINQILSLS